MAGIWVRPDTEGDPDRTKPLSRIHYIARREEGGRRSCEFAINNLWLSWGRQAAVATLL